MKTLATLQHEGDERGVRVVALTDDGKFVDPNSGEDLSREDLQSYVNKLRQDADNLSQALAASLRKERAATSPAEFGDLSHVDWLNEHHASPDVSGGQVVGLEVQDEDDADEDAYRDLTDAEFDWLGLDQCDLGSLEEHPEGSDRGGYLPTLTNGCQYSENAGEWYTTS